MRKSLVTFTLLVFSVLALTQQTEYSFEEGLELTATAFKIKTTACPELVSIAVNLRCYCE